MSRRDVLEKLSAPLSPSAKTQTHPATPALNYAPRPALALARSVRDVADHSKQLEEKLTAGQVIVELDVSVIEASFVADRMTYDGESYTELRQSIAEKGQNSPILVRPHPKERGRFQVAFGHRRWRAAKDLGKPVRAVVRELSDEELVIAQGQENSVRSDLSFIERARFAKNLEDNGYGRPVIMTALNADKSAVSKLISVTSAIPPHVIDAIGPAPQTGRAPWLDLATAFATRDRADDLAELLETQAFLDADSDERFCMVAEVFSEKPIRTVKRRGKNQTAGAGEGALQWAPSGARNVARMVPYARGEKILIDKAAPGFGRFIMQQMDRLYADFTKAKPAEPDASPRRK